MKPYGFKQHHHNHTDCHPKKGWVNWWEAEIDSFKSKKRARQEAELDMRNIQPASDEICERMRKLRQQPAPSIDDVIAQMKASVRIRKENA